MQQQGDVLIKRVGETMHSGKVFSGLPTSTKKLPHKTVAEGEVTGHAHRLSGDVALLESPEGDRYLQVGPKGASLTHEEHGPHTLEPGDYAIDIVREYDPWEEEIRQVRD